jgi:hypothetical protein
MAWGIFNKIKRGFKKIGSAFKKGAQFVNDKVIKPFKPIIKTAANHFIPGAGDIVEAASDGIDAAVNNDWGKVKEDWDSVVDWSRQRFKN